MIDKDEKENIYIKKDKRNEKFGVGLSKLVDTCKLDGRPMVVWLGMDVDGPDKGGRSYS